MKTLVPRVRRGGELLESCGGRVWAMLLIRSTVDQEPARGICI